MLNSDSRKRSAVGRMSREDGGARLRPFNRPPTTRMPPLLVLRLEVALAVIAALRTPRRAVAIGFQLVAGARLFAAGTLHQHAAALAIGDQAALAGRLERLLAVRRFNLVLLRRCGRRAMDRPIEIRSRQCRDLFAELLAQYPRLDLLNRTFGELCQLERAIGHPDQPVHFKRS